MSAPPLAALVRQIAPAPDAVPDAELLDRFVRSGDQAAFELLVWRHGTMVWGACLRVLGSDRDAAEDACQTAFVALASHAARLRTRDALAAWLHRVAVRAALDLRSARRAARPLPPDFLEPPARELDPVRRASAREVRAALDVGLDHLPDKLRVPFVLCELEGRSNAEAAAALGCPVGTVESRLTRARQRLRRWLTARGVVPAVAVTTVALPESARAAMVRASSSDGFSATVRAAAARAIPSAVAAKLRAVAAAGVLLAACAVGLGVTPTDAPKAPDSPKKTEAKAPDTNAPASEVKRPDREALPAGAVARFGSPLLRHGTWVFDVCFSADGKRMASVGMDATVRVWDATTGKQLFAVRRAEGDFGRVCFAPGGKGLVAVGHSPNLVADVWWIDATTGAVGDRRPLPGSPKIRKADPAVRFSPDGSRLAVGTAFSQEFVVFDSGNAKPLWSAKLGDETAGGVGFSADGTTVAVSTGGGKVRLFDPDGKPAGVLTTGDKALKNVALSPDGSTVVATTGEVTLAWARVSGKQLWRRTQHAGYTLAFSPDGKAIFHSGYGFRAGTLNPATGFPGGVGGKSGLYLDAMVEATCSAFRPDGSAVAFGTIGGTICLFDATTGKPVAPTADPPHEVRWLRFSPDGETLYGWSADWYAWDVASGKQTRLTHSGWNYGTPLSPDGKLTAGHVFRTGSRPAGSTDDGTRFEIRDVKTGAVLHSYPGKAFESMAFTAFTPDNKAVIGGQSDGRLRAWNVETGKELFNLPGHKSPSQYHAFSTDGRVLVTGAFGDAEEFPVRVYDVTTGKELAKFHPGVQVVGVTVSGDGRRVAAVTSASARGRADPREVAVVWEVPSAKPEGFVAGGKELVRIPQMREGKFAALSPDGRLLALAPDWEGDVRVYEAASGAERFAFRHDGQPTGLLFSPDGRALVAASKEAPVYLWDVTGEQAAKLPAWDTVTANRAWDDLASKDGAKAFAAIRQLRANPDKATGVLAERTKLPAVPANLKQVLVDLGSEDFTTRETATATLAAAGESVRSVMREEVRTAAPEAKRRLEELLKRLDVPTPARLRLVRAVEAVEGMNTPEARALLASWAKGVDPALATEAKAALGRGGK